MPNKLVNKIATFYSGDCLEAARHYCGPKIQLLLTSPPYPGQRGFSIGADKFAGWLLDRIHAWEEHMDATAVVVVNVMFKRRKGWFDTRLFDLPARFGHNGWHLIDTYIWDKLNAPPSGNHDRHDRNEWEFCFAFSRSAAYKFIPFRLPYSTKTVGKSVSGNMRKPDVYGNHAGGHGDLHSEGARQGNVLRMSSSGDQGRPRVAGGVFPRGLAERFIVQFTTEGDTVLDPFGGSGTVAVMALLTGRKTIYVDIDEKATKVAQEWIRDTIREIEQTPTQAKLFR